MSHHQIIRPARLALKSSELLEAVFNSRDSLNGVSSPFYTEQENKNRLHRVSSCSGMFSHSIKDTEKGSWHFFQKAFVYPNKLDKIDTSSSCCPNSLLLVLLTYFNQLL